MTAPFYLDKIIGKPGDSIPITQTCGSTGTITSSSDSVAFVTPGYDTVKAVGVGSSDITMTDSCGAWYTVSLMVTDDGLAPIVNQTEYTQVASIEIVVFGIIVAIASVYRMKYWMP